MKKENLMKKIRYNKFRMQEISIILIISILSALLYWIWQTPNVLFIANLVILILIVVKAKFSYFSMKALIMNYILFAVFFQYNTGESYGILEVSPIQLYYFKINLLIYIYNCISYLWISNTRTLENEKELLNQNYTEGKFSVYFCCFVAIATAIIAFPGLPFSQEYLKNRFVGLLQGSAWNHLSVVCLLFLLPNFRKNHFVKITYAFVIFWFISHYERVDVIGLLLFCSVFLLARKKEIKIKSYFIIRNNRNIVCIYDGIYR